MTKTPELPLRLIEQDEFPFEFISQLAARESWRKEIHRPIYHVHKWWAKRLGSVFRGILLGCALDDAKGFEAEFYRKRKPSDLTVFDPFMGSGTTIGEAHKLGFSALGCDINPVAAEAVRVALGPMERAPLEAAFARLSETVGERIRSLYRTVDRSGQPAEVLYHFWVMQAACPGEGSCCGQSVDLFSSRIVARNAYPNRKPEVQVLCPSCGDIFPSRLGVTSANCAQCGHRFNPEVGATAGSKATCVCGCQFSILDAIARSGSRPNFRLYGKLVLNEKGEKQYVPVTPRDQADYAACSCLLQSELDTGAIRVPTMQLTEGFNTRQAMGYGFRQWRDFFNDRQLLAIGWLQAEIDKIESAPVRDALLSLLSGTMEFNNLFASYKGEGTGAVRHMFAHHILKPERVPIEANLWGTNKSSGSFSSLFKGRLLRAVDYRAAPSELPPDGDVKRVASEAFSGNILTWPKDGAITPRGIYLACGDSSRTRLPAACIDYVVTDPPFFDNVHYSELADFFHAWQTLSPRGFVGEAISTRQQGEVQDTDATRFASKLSAVFKECHRLLKDNGLLAFTYHHSRSEGWSSLAKAILEAGFVVTNAQPHRAEMSGAAPKAQAKEPIQLDIVIVCRKASATLPRISTQDDALAAARKKVTRLETAGFELSRNDRKIVVYGQLLTTVRTLEAAQTLGSLLETMPEVLPGEVAVKVKSQRQDQFSFQAAR